MNNISFVDFNSIKSIPRKAPLTGNTLTGILEEVRFSGNGGFIIGDLVSGHTVKGIMLSPSEGMEYTFTGKWVNHERWGASFKFDSFTAAYPVTAQGIITYLDKNAKWIGPEIAKRIIAAFGESDALHILKTDPARVAREISGITPKRAADISAMLKANEKNEKLQIEVESITAGTGISQKAIAAIVLKYGDETPAIMRANPYSFIREIESIGFLTADKIARKCGYELTGKPRVCAGVAHALNEAAWSGGHTCLPIETLTENAINLLCVSGERIREIIKEEIAEGNLVRYDSEPDSFIYSKSFYHQETAIAKKLNELKSSETRVNGIPVHDQLKSDQITAINSCMENAVFILTGAPGTGKTFTIKRIIESFSSASIVLCAPTGKAARRMTELTGKEAFTIHKLLEAKMENGKFYFEKGAGNPLTASVIIVDEVSMIDTALMYSLLDAVKPGTRMIFVGDTYQLPSVGAGNLLKDMIAAGIPATELTEIKRQDAGLIIQNCHRIKRGEDIDCANNTGKDFFFVSKDNETGIQETILDLIQNRLSKTYAGLSPLRDVQIITPFREKTALSCKAFNELAQKRLNPAIDNYNYGGQIFKPGDKVIQTKNDYTHERMNGDIGFIKDIDNRVITVAFDNGKTLSLMREEAEDLELAYGLTCHKFQGSEAPIIIIPIHSSLMYPITLMQRNWLYTAISRAQKVCILVGQRRQVERIIERNQQQRRWTNLVEFLKAGKANETN